MEKETGLLYALFCVCTAIIGYKIHGSLFWAIVNFFLAPISWFGWLVCQDVNITIIKESFSFFFK